MNKLKNNLPGIIIAAVLVVVILLTCRVTYVPDQVKETYIDESGAEVVVEELTVAQQYCADNWEGKMLPAIREYAQDVSQILPQIKSDLASAGAQYAKRENETSAYNFCLKGMAKVLAIESPEKASKMRLVIDIQPYDGVADAKIQVSSVIKTNAIRDSVGFLKLDDFANQVEFADLTKAFNAKIQETVLADLNAAALEGQEVEFLGCVALTKAEEADDFLIIPIELKAGDNG